MWLLDKIKSFIPSAEKVKLYPKLQWIGDRPNLWYMNRRSVTRAMAIGVFLTWMPIPGHMLYAAFLCIFFSANLPIALTAVWINNPATMPFLFYIAYKLGCFILGETPTWITNYDLHSIIVEIETIGMPLILGSLAIGSICSVIAYFATSYLWHYKVLKKKQLRKKKNNSLLPK